MQTIICMKWGKRYDSIFVNRLFRSIKRHSIRRTRLLCFTDNNSGIDKEIECRPLPKIDIPEYVSNTPWRKISVWQYPLHDLEGDVLFLDLDLVITGNIDRFFDYKPGLYCVIENWTQKGKGIGNTSCFRFPVGNYSFIFSNFEKNSNEILKKFHIEQTYLSDQIKDQEFWPNQWCVSFKHDLLPKWPIRIWKAAELPIDTSLVAFTGKPDPDDVLLGKWPVPKKYFFKKVYKQFCTPNWVKSNWI